MGRLARRGTNWSRTTSTAPNSLALRSSKGSYRQEQGQAGRKPGQGGRGLRHLPWEENQRLHRLHQVHHAEAAGRKPDSGPQASHEGSLHPLADVHGERGPHEQQEGARRCYVQEVHGVWAPEKTSVQRIFLLDRRLVRTT